jgi:hypothetical protein
MIQQKQRHKKYNQRPNMASINNSPMSDDATGSKVHEGRRQTIRREELADDG